MCAVSNIVTEMERNREGFEEKLGNHKKYFHVAEKEKSKRKGG